VLIVSSKRIGGVALKHLDLLKLEMDVLGRAVALSGPISQLCHLEIVNSCLCDMLMEVRRVLEIR
jgi:hypothetical protein